MKEKFILFIISAVLLVGLAAGFLVKEETVAAIVRTERQANYQFLGQSAAESEARAERWYKSLFVKTHVTQFTFDLTAGGNGTSGTDNAKVDELASKGVSWWNARMRVMWSIVFQFMVRLSNLVVWAPLAFLVLAPFIVDAVVVRKVKSTNFALTSPHLQLIGVRAVFWIVLGFLILQTMPFVMHPIFAPIAIAALSFSTWVGICHFAKRA